MSDTEYLDKLAAMLGEILTPTRSQLTELVIDSGREVRTPAEEPIPAGEPFRCPNCDGDTFQEAGSVATVTPVELITTDDGQAKWIDYESSGSRPVWDASEGFYLECSHCLKRVEAEGFNSSPDPAEALSTVLGIIDTKRKALKALDHFIDPDSIAYELEQDVLTPFGWTREVT